MHDINGKASNITLLAMSLALPRRRKGVFIDPLALSLWAWTWAWKEGKLLSRFQQIAGAKEDGDFLSDPDQQCILSNTETGYPPQ